MWHQKESVILFLVSRRDASGLRPQLSEAYRGEQTKMLKDARLSWNILPTRKRILFLFTLWQIRTRGLKTIPLPRIISPHGTFVRTLPTCHTLLKGSVPSITESRVPGDHRHGSRASCLLRPYLEIKRSALKHVSTILNFTGFFPCLVING